MKIGILQCDHVSEEFRDSFEDYQTLFSSLFLAVDNTLDIKIYPVIDGVYPDATDECDGWVITGSRHGTYDNLPWMLKLCELIKKLDAEKRKLVGICFGHQLIADVLGGESGKSDEGWGVGVNTWTFNEKPSWMTGDDASFCLLVSHQDQVKQIPPGAKHIAGSDFCNNAAFQIGEHILTFQGHPEFPSEYSRRLMLSRADRIPADQLKTGLSSLEQKPDSEKVATWIVDFWKAVN